MALCKFRLKTKIISQSGVEKMGEAWDKYFTDFIWGFISYFLVNTLLTYLVST